MTVNPFNRWRSYPISTIAIIQLYIALLFIPQIDASTAPASVSSQATLTVDSSSPSSSSFLQVNQPQVIRLTSPFATTTSLNSATHADTGLIPTVVQEYELKGLEVMRQELNDHTRIE